MRPSSSPRRDVARLALVLAAAVMYAGVFVAGQASDGAGVVGPISTNNGQSACVEFGSCTDGGNYQTTETQKAAITPPASSVAYAPPTNSAESAASASELARTGGVAAFSSRVANGQGSGSAPNGATSSVDTAQVIAGSPPASVASATQTASLGNGAVGLAGPSQSTVAYVWTVMAMLVGIAAGGAVVL